MADLTKRPAVEEEPWNWWHTGAMLVVWVALTFIISGVSQCNADRKDERESLALAVENELSELRGLIETNARAIEGLTRGLLEAPAP